MPKRYSAKIILNVLKKAAFQKVSQKGSHIKLTKQTLPKVLTVIVPNHKEIAVGTFQSIHKQAGMTRKEFEKLI